MPTQYTGSTGPILPLVFKAGWGKGRQQAFQNVMDAYIAEEKVDQIRKSNKMTLGNMIMKSPDPMGAVTGIFDTIQGAAADDVFGKVAGTIGDLGEWVFGGKDDEAAGGGAPEPMAPLKLLAEGGIGREGEEGGGPMGGRVLEKAGVPAPVSAVLEGVLGWGALPFGM